MRCYLLPSAERWREQSPRCAKALHRAQALPTSAAGSATQFRDLLGIQRLPWAAALAQSHGVSLAHGRYLAIEALSLRAEPNGLYVLAAGDFAPEPVLQYLRTWLEPWLKDEGCGAWQLAGSTWLCRLGDNLEAPSGDHGDGILGAEFGQVLPESLSWQRRLNEAQMALHQGFADDPKAASLLASNGMGLAINSVWYFDAGEIPAQPQARAFRCFSQDPGLSALCRYLGHRMVEQPEQADWIDLRGWDRERAQKLWLDAPGRDLYACGSRMQRSRWDTWRFWRRSTD